MSAVPDAAIPEGMVWLPVHHPATNRLTIPVTDPESNEPNYKQCAVRLVAADQSADSGAARAVLHDGGVARPRGSDGEVSR